MRKINNKEKENLKLVKKGGGGGGLRSPLVIELMKLSVGETLLMERKEWKNKTAPASYLGQYSARFNKGFSTLKLADDKGWIITRTK